MKFKCIPLQVKEVSDAGYFSGYAAVFNNVDLGGDIIAPGAFAKTIKDRADHPVLWGHNPREVIGVNKSYVEDGHGLFVEGQLILDVQRAKEAHALMKGKAVRGISIGYDTVVDEYDKKTDVRTLKELKLYEYSLTAFPMNPEAGVLTVKTAEDLEELLQSIIRFKPSGPLSVDQTLIEKALERLSSLRAEDTSPAADMQQLIEPEFLHSWADRVFRVKN